MKKPLKEINGTLLYTQDELLRRVEEEVKSPKGKIGKSMFAYLRDIWGLIPKPIKIHGRNERGGAKSYYTEHAAQSTILVLKQNQIEGLTLKDIKLKFGDELEENKIRSNIVKEKIDISTQLGDLLVACQLMDEAQYTQSPKEKLNTLKPKSSVPAVMTKDLKRKVKDIMAALDSEKSDEDLDAKLEDLMVLYNKRLRYRVKGSTGKEVRDNK